jgi:hypothetical protein
MCVNLCICSDLYEYAEHTHQRLMYTLSACYSGAVPALVAQHRHWWCSHRHWWRSTGTGGAVPALVAQYRHWWRSV